jgi:hypothetical protein
VSAVCVSWFCDEIVGEDVDGEEVDRGSVWKYSFEAGGSRRPCESIPTSKECGGCCSSVADIVFPSPAVESGSDTP